MVVAPAKEEDLARSISLSGRLEADARVELRARVSGFLEEVAFDPGDVVEEGTVLYRIERGPYEAAVQEVQGALEAAQAVRDLALLERDRQAELVDRQASPQAVLYEAEAELGQAEGDLTRLQGTLVQAQLNVSYTEIIAPFAGRVGVSSQDVGALVGPETGMLVTLVQLDPIHAVAAINTAALRDFAEAVEAGEMSPDGAATLVLANGSTYGGTGNIDFVDSKVQQGTDSMTLRGRFDNPEGRLLDAELVRVVITQTTPQTALTVPQHSVQRDLQCAFAMVVDASGTVEQRRIEVGRIAGGLAVVQSQLAAGEMVITEGVNKVRPGITVDAAEAGEG